MAFKAKRSLRGTNVFVREDYYDRVAEKRKNLIPKMLEARKNGKRHIFVLTNESFKIHNL